MGKSLVMNLILNGNTTAAFDALGGKLTALGGVLEQVGGKVRSFEEDAVETYKNYETYMLEAQGALTAQYESQSKLARVMQGLDEHAQGWAESTIFDTRDVAKAISEAAHAGWTYEEMLEGIPQAMLLAQAGNLDLSTGLDYVIKALNATGTKFKDSDTLIDQWAMAANSGATNIGELGEALLRMGATARFGDSTAELFTMLAVLADMGTVGADAGTLLRNSMIRLIAPTQKASDVMAELGVTEEEALSIAADSDALDKANKLLEQTGFSAYDSNGNLKPFLDTYKELYGAVSGMSEVDKNAVLSAIFPTRTITGALGLLEAASKNYDGLYEKILGSDGYAQKVADIQTSGLMGIEEEFLSKGEEFSRKVGEELAPDKAALLEDVGGFIDKLNDLPEWQLSMLVGGLNTIATLGPSLLVAGGAIKMLTALGPVGASAVVTAIAVNAIARGFSTISEIDFESAFGNLELGLDEIGGYVDAIDTKFDLEQSAVSEWAEALATAQSNYLELTSTLSEDLLSASLTGRKLTDQEIADLEGIGEQMITSLRNGITNAEARDLTFIDMLFGDQSTPEEADAFTDAVSWIDGRYSNLYAQAEAIGQQLRDAMTSALADGTLNEQERQAIQATVDRMNQIQAEIAAVMAEEDYYAQLHKAQSVSWDSIETYLAQNAEKQKEDLAQTDELYHQMYGQLRAAWQNQYENAETGAERARLEAEWANTEANYNREWQEARKSVEGKYGEFAYTAFSALMRDSDYSDAWSFVEALWKDQAPTVDDSGSYDFGGRDLSKYLPDGVTAAEMEEQLYQLWRGEHGISGIASKITGDLLSPYMNYDQVAQIPGMIDSALDVELNPVVAPGALDGVVGEEPITVPVEFEASTATDELTGEATTTGAAAEGALQEGWANPVLEGSVDEDGIVGQASSAGAAAQAAVHASWGNPTLTATVRYVGVQSGSSVVGGGGGKNVMMKYAEGGRATTASIFGEAGPEWAIPEEHSARTAELLNQARQASGFTWGDLISRFGGLNATPNSKTVQLTYSPTIHAGDASGMAQALLSDKERLMRMLRGMLDEMDMRNDAEVYA